MEVNRHLTPNGKKCKLTFLKQRKTFCCDAECKWFAVNGLKRTEQNGVAPGIRQAGRRFDLRGGFFL